MAVKNKFLNETGTIEFKDKITFSDTLRIYKEIISIGSPLFSRYSLYAVKGDSDSAVLLISLYYRKNQFHIVEDKNIEKEGKIKIESKLLTIEDIADTGIDSMSSYKTAWDFPLIGGRFGWGIPLVKNREIGIDRHDSIYKVRLTSDSRRDLKKMTDDFYRILK